MQATDAIMIGKLPSALVLELDGSGAGKLALLAGAGPSACHSHMQTNLLGLGLYATHWYELYMFCMLGFA